MRCKLLETRPESLLVAYVALLRAGLPAALDTAVLARHLHEERQQLQRLGQLSPALARAGPAAPLAQAAQALTLQLAAEGLAGAMAAMGASAAAVLAPVVSSAAQAQQGQLGGGGGGSGAGGSSSAAAPLVLQHATTLELLQLQLQQGGGGAGPHEGGAGQQQQQQQQRLAVSLPAGMASPREGGSSGGGRGAPGTWPLAEPGTSGQQQALAALLAATQQQQQQQPGGLLALGEGAPGGDLAGALQSGAFLPTSMALRTSEPATQPAQWQPQPQAGDAALQQLLRLATPGGEPVVLHALSPVVSPPSTGQQDQPQGPYPPLASPGGGGGEGAAPGRHHPRPRIHLPLRLAPTAAADAGAMSPGAMAVSGQGPGPASVLARMMEQQTAAAAAGQQWRPAADEGEGAAARVLDLGGGEAGAQGGGALGGAHGVRAMLQQRQARMHPLRLSPHDAAAGGGPGQLRRAGSIVHMEVEAPHQALGAVGGGGGGGGGGAGSAAPLWWAQPQPQAGTLWQGGQGACARSLLWLKMVSFLCAATRNKRLDKTPPSSPRPTNRRPALGAAAAQRRHAQPPARRPLRGGPPPQRRRRHDALPLLGRQATLQLPVLDQRQRRGRRARPRRPFRGPARQPGDGGRGGLPGL